MVGDWEEVESLIKTTKSDAAEVNIARLLLALRLNDESAIAESVSSARQHLGAPITAAGRYSYRRSYEAVVNLHLVRELEIIHQTANRMSQNSQRKERRKFTSLTNQLSSRLNSTLPTFRAREPILSMRRIALGMWYVKHSMYFWNFPYHPSQSPRFIIWKA